MCVRSIANGRDVPLGRQRARLHRKVAAPKRALGGRLRRRKNYNDFISHLFKETFMDAPSFLFGQQVFDFPAVS